MLGFAIFAACVLYSSLIIMFLILRKENLGTTIWTDKRSWKSGDVEVTKRDPRSMFSGTHLSQKDYGNTTKKAAISVKSSIPLNVNVNKEKSK